MRKETNNNTSGFKVPDNYFEDFKNRIPEIVEEQIIPKERKTKQFSIYYAVAASIVLLIVSVFTFLPQQNTQETKLVLSQNIPDVDYYDIDMNDLYYAYNDNNEIIEEQDLSDEAMIDFIANEVDLDELILLSE